MATQEVTFKINANAAAAQAEFRKLAVAATASQKQIATANKQAASGATEFSNAIKQAAAAVGVLQGPLNGISGRITAFGTLARAASADVASVGTEAATTAGSVAAMAGPIGIAVAVVAGLTLGAGLLIKGMFDLAQGAAAWRGALFDTSQQVGISTETLSALEVVARTTGSSLGEITASLGIFQKNLEAAQDPANKLAKTFQELHVSTDNTETSLRETLKALAAMPEGFHQTATALELFGRGGKSILAMLKEMDGDLDGTIQKLSEMGLVVSREDAQAADAFNDQLEIMELQFRAMLGKEVIPGALEVLKDLSKTLKDNKDNIDILAKSLGTLSNIIGATLIYNVAQLAAVIDASNAPYRRYAQVVIAAADALKYLRGEAQATITLMDATAGISGSHRGDFGGGEAGQSATAAHQAARPTTGGRGAGRGAGKATKSPEELEAERQFLALQRAKRDITVDLEAELKKQQDIEHGLDVTTREYAVSQSLLNGELANASAEFREMAIGQAKFIDERIKRNKADAEYKAFLKDQIEAVRLVIEGEKGHIQIVEELINATLDAGVVLTDTEEHWLRIRAAILANNDALKMYMETQATVEVAGAATAGLGDESIAAQAGAAANAATEAEAAAADAAAEAIARHTDALNILKNTAMDTFSSLAQGIGGLIQNWVLLGNVGPQGLRKMVAAVLAAAAAQAAVEAIMELAYAAKEFALAAADAAIFNVVGAAGHTAAAHGHLTAAAIFGTVAAGAAVAGRLIAGNSFAASSGGGAGGGKGGAAGGKGATEKPQTTEQNRRNYEPVITTVCVFKRQH